MDVQLPNGLLVKDVPDGITKDELVAKLQANGIDTSWYEKTDKYPTLAAAADVPLSFARGATTGVKMISDFFGADNPVSQNLQSVDTYLQDLMSAQSKKDAAEISRIMADAKDKGVWDQVKAGVQALSTAPVDILTNAFGTAAPTIVAGLAATALAPEAAVGAGLMTAGRLAAGAVGAVSGAGTVKGTIYSDVKQTLVSQGVPEDVAEDTAVKAQSYNGKNLDAILGGAALGTIASATGLEQSAVKNILGRVITKSATDAVEQAGEQGLIKTAAKGFATEAAPEAAQAAQEQIASNVAQQREGLEVPTMRGVAGAAALEGIAGGILGGVSKVAEPRAETQAKVDEDAALRDALDVFNQNQKAKGLGPMLQLEDMTGNRLLAFANENRDKIPVLGQILDSGIPRDVKIEQLKKRLGDLPQYGAPTQPAVEGRVALPGPAPEGTVTSAAEAFSTAMKSNVPMTNLRVSQGPEGFRVVNENGEVITQQVKTEREANVLLEALRREQDAKNTGVYQQDVKAYEKERLPVITEAVARAAREVQTPITSFPMKDVKAVDEGVFNAVREMRKGRNLKADVTPEELGRLNVSPAVMTELTLKQKPVTGGGAAIRPEYETEIIGPRPSAPAPTARSAAQLAQEKAPIVTQTQPMSQFEQPEMVTLYKGEGMAGVGGERWTTDPAKARKFGRVNTVVLPQEAVNRFSQPGASPDERVFGKDRKPMELARIYTQPEDVTQEYSAVPEEDLARAPRKKKAEKPREVIQNAILQGEGEAPAAGFRPATGKQSRQARETYPNIAPEQGAPSAEAVAAAEKTINDRIARINKQGKQGEKVAAALREALDSGEFNTEQMLVAFQMADITARLLGTTTAAPHDIKFFNKLVEIQGGGRAYGLRNFATGAVQLATIPDVMTQGRNTAAHEAFHVLQDLFNEYDKGAARIIRDAFRGAKTVENISPDLLRKLRSLIDPETGKSYDVLVSENMRDLYRDAAPQKRERELQAYVFAALEDAKRKGVPIANFGGSFTRFVNFIMNFKERLGNYLAGKGYRNVSDIFEQTMTGEAQRGLGVSTERSGAKIIQRGKYEPEDLDVSPVLPPKPVTEQDAVTMEEIQATGQAPGLEGNANTYNKTWDTVREFFNPFAMVTNQKVLFQLRNRLFGKIGMSEESARKMSDVIAKANNKDRDAVYTYMTTRNANPSMIADPKVRNAAVQAKEAINRVGQDLVKQKFISQESYDQYYDQYLPRTYLYYELTGRGKTTPLGGLSQREYTMQRKDLTKEERDLLGEIKDPAYLVYVALSRPARDLAMAEYLNNLGTYSEQQKGAQWVLPTSMVEWKGHRMTPYALRTEAENIRKYVLPVAESHSPEQARLMLANINEMERIANEGFAAIARSEDKLDTENYRQMPKDPRYGILAGAIVQKGIYNDLVGTFIPMSVENRPLLDRVLGDEQSTLGKISGLWKLGKTTLNLPTQVRNFVSNMIALNVFAGVPLYKIPGLMKRAITEMTRDSQNWKDAQEFGIKGGTMSSAELKAALDRLKNYELRQKKDNPLIHAFAAARSVGTAIVEKAGDAYQGSEVIFKFMAFLNEREKQGFKRQPALISEAITNANEALFDYTLVNPNIRWLRNTPLGLPFITYYYKALPKFIETAYKHPMRFAPYIALATALPLYTMAELDLTPDELEAMRKTLPDFIRNNGSLYFLPYRDKDGNIAYVDLAPYLPWSTFTDPFIEGYRAGPVTGAKEMVKPFIPAGPVITAVAAMSTGNDPFTNKPIMDPRDTPTAQATAMISYIWNQAMPPMFSVNLNDMDQSGGAIPRVYNSLFVDGTGTDKRGLPKPDANMTALRLLGFNATPLKADMQRSSNINYMLSQIRKREAYRGEIAKNQSMTQQKRMEKIQQINQQIAEDYKKLQEYATETAPAVEAAQRLRQEEQ